MRTSNRQKAKRVTALVFLLCFVMLALLSEAFIFFRSNHEHDHFGAGGGCAVCVQIQNAEEQLKQLGAVISGTPAVWLGLFAVALALLSCASIFRYSTPVHLKTRLNN